MTKCAAMNIRCRAFRVQWDAHTSGDRSARIPLVVARGEHDVRSDLRGERTRDVRLLNDSQNGLSDVVHHQRRQEVQLESRKDDR